MKKSVRIAFSGIIAALIAAVMTASLIPNATFAVPAIAGLFIIAVYAEAGVLTALSCFAVSAGLSFFIGDKTSWILFVALFGYYPAIKPYLEKIGNIAVKWLVKVTIFNLAALCCYLVEILLLGLILDGLIVAAVWMLGNVAFVMYDIAVSRIAALYYARLHNRISSILKKG